MNHNTNNAKKKYVSPKMTKLGSLYAVTNAMNMGNYADAFSMMMMA